MEAVNDPIREDIPGVGDDYDGMMDALVDIQQKGDNMMAGIWWQKDILEKLETSLEEAEGRMEAAEVRNAALDDQKDALEAEVADLEAKRLELYNKMSKDEQQISRLKHS